METAAAAAERGPLDPVVSMVPGNFFEAASSNRNMLQVVFFAIFAGIALLMIPREKAKPLLDLFESLNDMIIRMVEIIMLICSYRESLPDGGNDHKYCWR